MQWTGTNPNPPTLRRKILVVDDDKYFLEELSDALGSRGYDVVMASDSVLALDKVMTIHPDLILLDIKMPAKDGFAFADELRNLLQITQIPIIAMTAFLKESYLSLLKKYGIAKCLAKPFSPPDLVAAIEESLR